MKILQQTDRQMIIRLDKGDNLIVKIQEVVSDKQIAAATFAGIGATNDLVLSYFDLDKKVYLDQKYEEGLEILSLNGNIARAENDEIIVHVHGIFGSADYSTIGGHVKHLVVSVTCEIVLNILKDPLARQTDGEFGLKLLN